MKFRSKTNLIVDIVMLLLLAAMAGLGFLIKYILVAGFKCNEIYGSKVDLYFMGLDRHQWGTVHLWVSLIFIFFILVHIFLHWKMIVCFFQQMFSSRAIRITVVSILIFLVALLSLGSFLVKPEISKAERHYFNQRKG